jgi:hypothetical protein
MLTFSSPVMIVTFLVWAVISARAHDIYTEMTKGTPCSRCSGKECGPVEVQVLDQDHYYLPASGETLPSQMARPSPDGRFHRCTYPLNEMWGGASDPRVIIVPDNSTRDGMPRTRCLWAPRELS